MKYCRVLKAGQPAYYEKKVGKFYGKKEKA